MDRIKVKILNFKILKYSELWDNLKDGKLPNTYELSRIICNDKANVKRPSRLRVMLYYDDIKDDFTIKFNGSIRKWYFGENTRQNLSKQQLIECVKLLSDKIGIREIDLLNAKVTQLEIGVTLLLKSDFKGIMNCFVKYRSFRREVEGTTIYFKGKKNKEGKENNIKYKFYEKYLEINKNYKNFEIDPIKINVHKKFFFFRFEIVIKKVSGIPFYKENAETINDIIKNWKTLNNKLMERFEKIQFVDLISEEKIIDSNKISKRDIEKHLKFQTIKRNGFHEELERFELSNTSTNRSTKIKAFFKNYEMFLDKKIDYKSEICQAFKKKIDSLV